MEVDEEQTTSKHQADADEVEDEDDDDKEDDDKDVDSDADEDDTTEADATETDATETPEASDSVPGPKQPKKAGSLAKETGLQLPIARVKRIVKADPDVKLISSDATFLIAKSTELFLELLAAKSYQETRVAQRKIVKYDDIASVVANNDSFVFLLDLIPQRTAKKDSLIQTTLI